MPIDWGPRSREFEGVAEATNPDADIAEYQQSLSVDILDAFNREQLAYTLSKLYGENLRP